MSIQQKLRYYNFVLFKDNLNMEEAKTMFEDIEKDECNKAVIESGDCKVDIIKDDKVTTTEATDMKEPESLTTTSDLGKDISV